MDGRPFFVVSCAVDPGLLSVLREQIVPRLKADVPNQPTLEQLEADPLLTHLSLLAGSAARESAPGLHRGQKVCPTRAISKRSKSILPGIFDVGEVLSRNHGQRFYS